MRVTVKRLLELAVAAQQDDDDAHAVAWATMAVAMAVRELTTVVAKAARIEFEED